MSAELYFFALSLPFKKLGGVGPCGNSGGLNTVTATVGPLANSGRPAFEQVQNRRALRLRGTVSLAQNGGFLQVARVLDCDGPSGFDARAYDGLLLDVCGVPGPYFMHLRTSDTRAPWQYYAAPLTVSTSWHEVHLLWSAFTPSALRAPLAIDRLQRIGIVAAQAAFHADIAVSRIAFTP